jgi:hypothetical protein
MWISTCDLFSYRMRFCCSSKSHKVACVNNKTFFSQTYSKGFALYGKLNLAAWQAYGYTRPFAFLALHFNGTAVVLNHAKADGEA